MKSTYATFAETHSLISLGQWCKHCARSTKIRIFPYLDDFPAVDSDQQALLAARKTTSDLLQRLGLQRHPDKGQWTPTQTICHLGILIDTQKGIFQVPSDKLASIKSNARSLLTQAKRHRRWCPTHRLEAFVGTGMSLTLALPAARTWSRSLYDALAARRSTSKDVKLSRQAQKDLQAFVDLDASKTSAPIWPQQPTMMMTTDASSHGWGACNDQEPARGFFSARERNLHITAKELLAVERALQRLPPTISNTAIRLRTDNTAVMFALRNRVSASPTMMTILRRVLSWMDERHLQLRPECISTDLNPADPLSRRTDNTDWSINRSVFQRWTRAIMTPTIDSWRVIPGSEGDAPLLRE